VSRSQLPRRNTRCVSVRSDSAHPFFRNLRLRARRASIGSRAVGYRVSDPRTPRLPSAESGREKRRLRVRFATVKPGFFAPPTPSESKLPKYRARSCGLPQRFQAETPFFRPHPPVPVASLLLYTARKNRMCKKLGQSRRRSLTGGCRKEPNPTPLSPGSSPQSPPEPRPAARAMR
jgi:hypothetical protein